MTWALTNQSLQLGATMTHVEFLRRMRKEIRACPKEEEAHGYSESLWLPPLELARRS
jgi:hypothetical protein